MALPFDFSQMQGVQPQVNNAGAQPSLGTMIAPQQGAPAQGQPPNNPEELKKGWLEYIQRPEIQSGMLQFAINVLQPVGPGQSTLGKIAGSVGAGGEAVRRTVDRDTAEAQRQTENLQKQEQIDLQREGVEVDRERVGVQREGLEVDRGRTDAIIRGQDKSLEATRERIKADKDLSDATIDGMWNRLQAQIDADEKRFGRQADSALLQASVEAAFAGIDPLLFDTTTPEGMQQYNQALDSAFSRGMQNYFMLRQIQPYESNPAMYSDEFVSQALRANPTIAQSNLRAMGVPEEIIQRNMPEPQAAPAPTSGTTTPAQTTTPTPEATQLPQTQAPAVDQPGFNVSPEAAAGAAASFEAQAEAERAAAQAADPLGFAFDELASTEPGTEAYTKVATELKNALPATVAAVPADKFFRLYQNPKSQGILYETFGKEEVEKRATSLKLNTPIHQRP